MVPLFGTAGRNRTSISSFVARGILHYTTAVNWYPEQDLNLRPTPYQGAALPLSYPGKICMVPGARIELAMTGYQPIVIPFNYPGIPYKYFCENL